MKYQAFGATLREVAEERERQAAVRERMPGAALAKMLTVQMSKNADTAVHDRIIAAAIRRANPNERAPPTTEIERLVAQEPKSSAQVIGHHRVPNLKPPPPKARQKISEIERMRTVFPGRESGVVGFHHDFGEAKIRDAAEAQELLSRLKANHVQKDKELANALGLLQQHVKAQATYKDFNGIERGIVRR